ncbi:MAG: patatin-like phospholipase family protein [Bilifractor sp.]|jgi:predicted patatin/cPLA2 family phospholipase
MENLRDAALVLEGGAMRGIFTSGVLDVLMENECWFSYVIGVSAGSCNAADYVSRQVGRSRDCIAVEDKSHRYVHGDLPSMIRGKAFDLDRLCFEFTKEYMPFDFKTYSESEMEAEYVATNAKTGKAEYFSEKTDEDRLYNLIAASCSMPLITELRPVDDGIYADGGITDSIPVVHAMKKGYKKIFAVLTRPFGYRKQREKKMEILFRRKYRDYPNLVKALCTRYVVYDKTLDLIEKWESEGRIFVIRPEMPAVSHTEQDTGKLLAFYRHGINLMEERYGDLERYLNAD